ncbi:hypothetical protein SS05631_c36830 [Sinorhizobium sp. CCBAU 05631]|nr:hypothetical protein SS05631_c36830 [Sinorhizobium sp. CCBAU 05631]
MFFKSIRKRAPLTISLCVAATQVQKVMNGAGREAFVAEHQGV